MDTEKQIVEDFAKGMIAKISLRHARYTPMGWATMDVKRLLMLLRQELDELENATNLRADEAIDVANYACFIWFLTKGQLPEPPDPGAP